MIICLAASFIVSGSGPVVQNVQSQPHTTEENAVPPTSEVTSDPENGEDAEVTPEGEATDEVDSGEGDSVETEGGDDTTTNENSN
jgi:hypothetical protein